MNYKIICALLGMVAVILGACMFFCLPWGLPAFGGGESEGKGAFGLLTSGGLSIGLGAILTAIGRGADESRLFRKEAIVIVVGSWIVAVLISALPYLFSGTMRAPGTPMSFADALFESASGLTTTGATIFGELEDSSLMPRSILFWRMTTHFLGGLGVMCFFVVLIGQGSNGKTVMKLEHATTTAVPIAKMRVFAIEIFKIYIGLTLVCVVLLLFCGMNLFDAISHAFSVVALGGFSTKNASVAFYDLCPDTNGFAIETILVAFMVVAATNYWLLYWVLRGQPGRLFKDTEWRFFLGALLVGLIVTVGSGIDKGDFREATPPNDATIDLRHVEKVYDENGAAVKTRTLLNRRPSVAIDESVSTVGVGTSIRRAVFQVVSLATGAGFATHRYENWNAASLLIISALMFIGGCAGSTAGGAKVFRVVLAIKAFALYLAETYSPNVVRVTRMDGENVDKDSLRSAVVYIFLLGGLVFLVSAISIVVEPDTIWLLRDESQVEKAADMFFASVSMFANVGPALGVFGSFENYGALSDFVKILFSWAMLLGRLEIWIVLSLFAPNFWRNR